MGDETAGWFVPDGFKEFARQRSRYEPRHPSTDRWSRLESPNVAMFLYFLNVLTSSYKDEETE